MTEANVTDLPYAAACMAHQRGDFEAASVGYAAALNDRPDDPFLLAMMGQLQMQAGNLGNAAPLLERSVGIDPTNPDAINNLAYCWRQLGHHDRAESLWRPLLEAFPDNVDYLNNFASLYVDQGCPERGLEMIERALAIDPAYAKAHWNRALLYLEQGRFAEGWDEYAWGYRGGGRHNRQYDAGRWDGSPVKTLVVYGEQGIGDEVMFASMIPDAMRRCEQLIIDGHPRLKPLFERSFPGAVVYPTRKEGSPWVWDHKIDAKIAMADLGAIFRRSPEMFPGTPYLVPDAAAVEKFRRQFKAAAGSRLIVGIAWMGGSRKTGRRYRSIMPPDLMPLFGQKGAWFVSLQYGKEEVVRMVKRMRDELGVSLPHWQEPIDDFDALTAMAAACDVVITVDQTLWHQCGAIGKECWVLTPDRVSWRLSKVFGDGTPWYKSVLFYRQEKDGDWSVPVARMADELRARIDANVSAAA